MRISGIKTCDISNGPGLRVSLWTQGCPFRCEGCHNEETWNMNGRRDFDWEDLDYIEEQIKEGQNLSILGGEPLMQLKSMETLLSYLKQTYPKLNIWLWTGFSWDIIEKYPIMKFIDVIVTEKFDKNNLADFAVTGDRNDLYRGSRNQEIIMAKKSFETGEKIYYAEEN